MPTQGTEDATMAGGTDGGLGAAVKRVTEHASELLRLEVELATIELKRKAAALGAGIGLAVGAAVFGLFALGFAFATIAAALSTFLDVWIALFLVTLFLLLVAGLLGFLGLRAIKRGTPPVPQQAIEEAKRTTSALKGNGSR